MERAAAAEGAAAEQVAAAEERARAAEGRCAAEVAEARRAARVARDDAVALVRAPPRHNAPASDLPSNEWRLCNAQ